MRVSWLVDTLLFRLVRYSWAGGKASSLLHDLRPAKSTEAALQLPPPGKCPTAILRHPARSRKVVETFEECLLRHGKDINRRVVTKCVRRPSRCPSTLAGSLGIT